MTTSDTFNQAQDYFLSSPMALSAADKAVLALGRELTKELDLDQSIDTLGRWMAHYIAELIHCTENANTEERPEKMRLCSEVILNLWKHRHHMSNGKRPLEELEPALRALESLDPDNNTPRYFRPVRNASDEADNNDEAKSWLKLIDGLDYSAKMLIRYCLTKAVEKALDRSAEWVALAEAAGANDDEFTVIRQFFAERSLMDQSSKDETAKKQLQDRIDRLDSFIEMATALASELKDRTHDASPDIDQLA